MEEEKDYSFLEQRIEDTITAEAVQTFYRNKHYYTDFRARREANRVKNVLMGKLVGKKRPAGAPEFMGELLAIDLTTHNAMRGRPLGPDAIEFLENLFDDKGFTLGELIKKEAENKPKKAVRKATPFTASGLPEDVIVSVEVKIINAGSIKSEFLTQAAENPDFHTAVQTQSEQTASHDTGPNPAEKMG